MILILTTFDPIYFRHIMNNSNLADIIARACDPFIA